MARRAFFSFYYDRDIWRANVVRNSWVTQDREAAGFFDASLWEEAKRSGVSAIKKLIDEGLKNTTVTVVLIGAETADREYVRYEILQSYYRSNGLLGIRIHNIRSQIGLTDLPGSNPFDKVYIDQSGIRTYDWKNDDGYTNLGIWIEDAYKKANPS